MHSLIFASLRVVKSHIHLSKEKQITMSEEAPACRSAPGSRVRAMAYIEEVQVSPYLYLPFEYL